MPVRITNGAGCAVEVAVVIAEKLPAQFTGEARGEGCRVNKKGIAAAAFHGHERVAMAGK